MSVNPTEPQRDDQQVEHERALVLAAQMTWPREIVCEYGPLTCGGVPIVVGQFWGGDTRAGTC